MKIKAQSAMLVAGFIAILQATQASEIGGTFAGEVYAAQGTQEDVNLAALVGLPIG
jgi:hypothetical protein